MLSIIISLAAAAQVADGEEMTAAALNAKTDVELVAMHRWLTPPHTCCIDGRCELLTDAECEARAAGTIWSEDNAETNEEICSSPVEDVEIHPATHPSAAHVFVEACEDDTTADKYGVLWRECTVSLMPSDCVSVESDRTTVLWPVFDASVFDPTEFPWANSASVGSIFWVIVKQEGRLEQVMAAEMDLTCER